MEPLNQSADTLQGFFASFWDQLITLLPNVLGAILLILIGWGVAKLIGLAIKRLLRTLNFDDYGKKFLLQTSLRIDREKVKPSDWVGKFVFWVILLVFLVSASETLGWTAVSESISDLTMYLPQLFSAFLILVIGLYIASFVRGFMSNTFDTLGLSGGKILSEVVFYIILLIIGTTALEQAGIETSIITANIAIIIGGILLAFALGFGYSSREFLTNTLSSFYARNTFTEGQTIRIDDVEGIITQIDNIQTTITTKEGELIIPNRRLISESIIRVNHKTPSSVPKTKETTTVK